MVVGGNGDSIYSRLMAAVGRQDMAADNPDFADNSRRCEREDEINEVRSFSPHKLQTAWRPQCLLVTDIWRSQQLTTFACV